MKRLHWSVVGLVALAVLAGVTTFGSAAGTGADWFRFSTTISANPFAVGTPGVYSKNTDGRPRAVSAAGREYRLGTTSDVEISAGPPAGIALGSCWSDSTNSYRIYCKESGGNLAQRTDLLAPGTIGCGGTPAAGCFTALTATGNIQLGDAAADVLTNKATLRIENTANTFYVSLTHAATANRAVTFPDAAGILVLDAATQTLSGKTLASPALTGTTSGAGLVAKANGGTGVDNSAGIAQYAFWGGPSSGAGAATYRTLVAGDLNTATSTTRTTGGGVAALGAATVYLTAPGQNASATEVPLAIATRSGVARNLCCYAGTAPGGADTVVVTLRKNAADSAVTYTVPAAGTAGCDTTNTVSEVQGDRWSLKAVSSGALAAGLSCSFEETPG